MHPFFRLLGLAARIGETLSRRSINFLPLHWLLMGLLGALVAKGTQEVGFAWRNDATPKAVGIAEVLAHRDLDHDYVAVRGTLVPAAVFEYTRSSNSGGTTVEASYLPLYSREDRKALLVRRSGRVRGNQEPREATVTGLLVPIDSDVRRELDKVGGNVDGLPFDRDWMLEEGRAPGALGVWLGITAAAGVFLLALLATWQRRYVVFQAAPAPAPPQSEAAPERLDVRASGRFAIIGHKDRRFLDVPVQVGWLRSGRIGVMAAVDASSHLFGVKTVDRSGLWTIPIEAEVFATLEPGYQYLGFHRRPALRLLHTDAKGRTMATILACQTEAGRRELVRDLAALVAAPPAPETEPATG